MGKFLPALTIDEKTLLRGTALIKQSINEILQEKSENLKGGL